MSSTNDSVTIPKATTSDGRLIGRVKWFNNKAGYGFVTITDGAQAGTDIFTHHSAIGVSTQQYRYLVQGEYIEFSITPTEGGVHAFQASNISGIRGGKLMCETRNETKSARISYKKSEEQQTQTHPVTEPVKMPRQQKSPKPQKDEEQKEWTLIKGNTNNRETKPTGRGRGRPKTTNTTK